MTKRHGPGVFTTLLLLIPMLAVPVMALFGVPHFMPVVASPTHRQDRDATEQYRETRISQSAASLRPVSLQMKAETVDLFQPYAGSETTAVTGPARQAVTQLDQDRNSWTDPLHVPRILNNSGRRTAMTRPESNSDSHPQRRAGVSPPVSSSITLFDPPPDRPAVSRSTASGTSTGSVSRYERQSRSSRVPTDDPAGPQPLNWRQASRLLEQLGVSTYSLSPGLNPGEFRFVCLVSSSENPRVSRRFESHSPDPLVAVEQVIDQVRSWTRPHSH